MPLVRMKNLRAWIFLGVGFEEMSSLLFGSVPYGIIHIAWGYFTLCSYHAEWKKLQGDQRKAELCWDLAVQFPHWSEFLKPYLAVCQNSPPALLPTWSKSFTFPSLIFSDFKVSQINYIASFLLLISSSFLSWVRKVIWRRAWGDLAECGPYRGSGNDVGNFEERQKWC